MMDRALFRALRIAGPIASTLVPPLHSCLRSVRTESSADAGSGDLQARKLEIVQQARNLRQAYDPAYAFPRWVCDHYLEKHFLQFEDDASGCAIFYDECDPIGQVLLLATEREPVNVGMRRMYDQAKFASEFGWQHGAYGTLAGHTSRLPPNIAIMCPTPIVSSLSGPDQEISEEQARDVKDPSNRAYILSVIAYAFDSPRQPDQAYFLTDDRVISAAKRAELTERFGRIFDKVFAAALHYQLEVIVLSKFGAGAFSENYPGVLFEDVWLPAFRTALAAWRTRLHSGGVLEISLMGGEREEAFAETAREAGFSNELYTYFPDPLRRQLGSKLPRSLLVNAWDSWSLIGNGNFADRSLDGFVGRTTALAVLGWPLTNPRLKDCLVSVRRPA